MKRLNIFLALVTALITFGTVAQQDAHFTQYVDNAIFSNPAYAGSKGTINASVLHREQWTRIEGYPRTSTFSIHSPLSYESVGVGLSFVNDVAGPIRQSMVMANMSYAIRFKNSTRLAMGLNAGVNVVGLDREKLYNAGKAVSGVQGFDNRINPNIGVGLIYFGRNFFIGASSPKVIENSYDNSGFNLEKQHYYFHAGYVFTIGTAWKLRPAMQAKGVHGSFGIDGSLTGIYKDQFFLGILYRLDAAVGAFVQVQVLPQLKIGLGSDFGIQEIRKHNAGTFEALVSYDFQLGSGNGAGMRTTKGVYSPRYF